MSESSDTPFLPVIPHQPYIEAQYANPRLAVYLKCLLYKQIRIDVDPRVMEGEHRLAQVKALIKDHYINWQQRHSDHLALKGYLLFISNGKSVRFLVWPPAHTTEGKAGAEEPRIIIAAINDGVPANSVFRRSGGRPNHSIC